MNHAGEAHAELRTGPWLVLKLQSTWQGWLRVADRVGGDTRPGFTGTSGLWGLGGELMTAQGCVLTGGGERG